MYKNWMKGTSENQFFSGNKRSRKGQDEKKSLPSLASLDLCGNFFHFF